MTSDPEPAPTTAKLFWTGRSQAVRLPKAFRLEGSEVRIRRSGNQIILEQVTEDWDWLEDIAGEVDDDFVEAAQRRQAPQDRPNLDSLFD